MATVFLGVYKAIYDYQAQNDEELDLTENDLLYLLEKSEVDDWWKVKRRVVGSEAEEPQGLVPSNYIEPAQPVSTATALYDYDKQTEEEITFTEGATFDVYDTSDPDWILVGLDQAFGFVPANYIDIGGSTAAPAIAYPVPQQQTFLPPPQRVDRIASSQPEEEKDLPPVKPTRPQYQPEYDEAEDEYEAPPPMPNRPRGNSSATLSRRGSSYSGDVGGGSGGAADDFVKDDFFTWPVQEINGRKKKKATLGIGNSSIYVSPEGSHGGSPQQWDITDLVSFNLEGKRVFLDLKHPLESFELHAGSKDAAEAIASILGDLKGAASMNGLREVKEASIPSGDRKTGKVLYDFVSDSPDELTVYEGESVYIINDRKSKDWWMVENVNSGERGVVPSNFIKVSSSTSGGSTLGNFFRRRGSSQSLLSPSKSKNKKKEKLREREREREYEREEAEAQRQRQKRREREMRDREAREKVRRRDEREREKSSKKSDSNDKSKPNPHRVRTWIDRSGSFKVEAEFLGCSDGKIHLHKLNGVKIAVAAPKLCSEDLEYVERITGMSLESYKPQPEPVQTPTPQASNSQRSGAQVSEPTIPKISPAKDPDYDWFEFFLNCGVEVNNCQRYTLNFNKEQMDENILEDISPSLLRTLGLREGDILRVMKFLDNKYDRKRDQPLESATTGGLFSGADGSLKNNRSDAANGGSVNGTALNGSSQKFEDDAWAVKPAAQTQQPTRPPSVPTQQLTGSLQDLVNIKPVESKSATPLAPATTGATNFTPLQPNKTSSVPPLQMQKTQATGGFIPIPVQPTGFMPIGLMPTMTGMTMQPTGLIPLQKTGTFIPMQPTGLIPLQKTGLTMPQTTFGAMPLQKTGGFIPMQPTGLLPQQTFGAGVPLQKTGGLVPVQQTGFGAMPQTSFGVPAQKTGFQPTSSFGVMLAQKTGGIQPMATGAQPFYSQQPLNTGMPPTSFGNSMVPLQKTGGFGALQTQIPTTSFGAAPGFNGLPTGQFQQQQQQQQPFQSFGQQPISQQTGINGLTNMFQNTSLNQQTGFNQGNGFGNLQTGLNQGNGYGNGLGNGFGNGVNGFNNFQQQPQQPFTSFNSFDQQFQPLQSQPTGLGFGNAPSTSFGQPLQSQPTGRRANLAAATADNPFGF
ncbi:unnamed protein product [Kuraishia capsulata CBS 1993]|uniref:Actin cytoskeleton-regulatory complex protein SLA1 n=1 Tax=Kuraishia capsulata CBS 1993 TaxID=1382522 RepID=W6MPV1_9ASCO|nr:uncharacterized protein KUCA_T00003190001 [Kuraishia capsulata CBS 1993]CDK27212.1 unnamed protein product [Kuraishia capsulata CBS 1993]